MLGQAGLFLAIPSLFTLLCLGVGVIDAGAAGGTGGARSWRAGMVRAGSAYRASRADGHGAGRRDAHGDGGDTSAARATGSVTYLDQPLSPIGP